MHGFDASYFHSKFAEAAVSAIERHGYRALVTRTSIQGIHPHNAISAIVNPDSDGVLLNAAYLDTASLRHLSKNRPTVLLDDVRGELLFRAIDLRLRLVDLLATALADRCLARRRLVHQPFGERLLMRRDPVPVFGDLDGAVDGELVTFRGIKHDLRQQLIDDTIADLAQILIHDEDGTRPTSIEDCFDSESIAEALRYVKRDYAFFDAASRSGNDMQMYDRVKNVLKQMLLAQAACTGVEPHYGGIPRDYALEILVSTVSSIIWCGFGAAARRPRSRSARSSSATRTPRRSTSCTDRSPSPRLGSAPPPSRESPITTNVHGTFAGRGREWSSAARRSAAARLAVISGRPTP